MENYAERLARLIRCRTVAGEGEENFAACRDALKELFPRVFSVCRVENFEGSLLLVWRGASHDKPVLFMNHYDVVAAGEGWTQPPFGGKIDRGVLWGRGTLDDKGGLYAMLEAAEGLMGEGFVPRQDIYFVSTRTEETTGQGADRISAELQKRGLRFEFSLDEGGMILYDPIGGADAKFAMIALGEKGCADIRFIARSRGGHASRPGKNTPLVRLGCFMRDMEKRVKFETKLPVPVRGMLRQMALYMKQPLRCVMGHPDLFAPLLALALPAVSVSAGSMMKTTLAFTMAKGSDARNALPQEAYVIGNMRYSHHEGLEKSLQRVEKVAKKYDIGVEVLERGMMGSLSDPCGAAYARLTRALKKTHPDVVPAPYIASSASDNRFMSRVTDACFGFTPFFISDEQLNGIHGSDESVDVASLAPAVAFYREMMKGE